MSLQDLAQPSTDKNDKKHKMDKKDKEGQEGQATSSVLPCEEYECNPPHVVAVVAPRVVHGTIEQAQPSTSTEQLLM